MNLANINCAFSQREDIAFLTSGETIVILSLQKLIEVGRSTIQSNRITSICCSPDGKYVSAILVNGLLKLWNTMNFQEESWAFIDTPIKRAFFSADSERFITLDNSGNVNIWNIQTREKYCTVKGIYDINERGMKSDSSQLILLKKGTNQSRRWMIYAEIFDLSTKSIIGTIFSNDLIHYSIGENESIIDDCFFSPNDKFIITISWNDYGYFVEVWDSLTLHHLSILNDPFLCSQAACRISQYSYDKHYALLSQCSTRPFVSSEMYIIELENCTILSAVMHDDDDLPDYFRNFRLSCTGAYVYCDDPMVLEFNGICENNTLIYNADRSKAALLRGQNAKFCLNDSLVITYDKDYIFFYDTKSWQELQRISKEFKEIIYSPSCKYVCILEINNNRIFVSDIINVEDFLNHIS